MFHHKRDDAPGDSTEKRIKKLEFLVSALFGALFTHLVLSPLFARFFL